MGLDREAGMEDVLHQDLTTQVWARLGQVWATAQDQPERGQGPKAHLPLLPLYGT